MGESKIKYEDLELISPNLCNFFNVSSNINPEDKKMLDINELGGKLSRTFASNVFTSLLPQRRTVFA